MSPRRIAVVGGGATGLAVVHALDALAAAAPVDLELQVVLIEQSGSVGPGLAYGTCDAGHLINMPAGTMGFAGAGDFQRWRDGAGDAGGAGPDARPAVPSRYPPRALYGRYLASIAGDLLQRRARGLSLQVIRDEVTAIEPSDGAVTLALRQRAPVRVQSAVLAIGALPPTTYTHLAGCRGYVGSPWPSEALQEIPTGADVAILGSSLTAIDAVRSLIGHGHTGQITLVSRHGYLPKVQGDTARYAGSAQLRRRLAALLCGREVRWRSVLAILSDEIGTLGGGWSLHEPPGDPLDALRREIEAAQAGRTAWQEVLVATAGIIEELWNAMTIAERQRFDRDLSAAWAANRHPMPLPNALFLERALASGQLRVLGGADVRMAPGRSGARFVLDGTDRPATSRWLVNCTGAGRDVTQARSALLRGLLASGQIAAHPCGGIAVDFASFRPVDGLGRRSPGLFVVGPLTRGVHFYTHAIERHVEHARRVAAQLLDAPAGGHDRPAAAAADAWVVPA